MDEIREKRTVIHDQPGDGRPVIESQYDRVNIEPRGMSGAAIAAMIIGAVLVAMFITWLIINNQQNEELAMERERALIAERNAAQAQTAQQQQQPQQPIVVMPQSQPSTVPVPVPVPVPAEPTTTTPSNTSIEIDVNRKLLDDRQLSPYPITVKVENGTATLEGSVPTEELKTRAEKVTSTIKGVRGIINNITVRE
jgi:hypothetical protein